MNASEIAKHAAGLVSGDRHTVHGDKHVTFDRIVRLWNAYMQCRFGIGAPTLTPLDAAQMMSLLKKARAMSGAHNPDDYVDDVGYAAIAGELAARGERAALLGAARDVAVAVDRYASGLSGVSPPTPRRAVPMPDQEAVKARIDALQRQQDAADEWDAQP